MTERFFWEDPYLDRLDSRVAAVDGDWITLDRTIFFAFSGGQESDRGRIGGHEVLEAVADGPGIRYRLAPDHGLEPGAPVTAEIDMTRRYRLMRLHFAAELVLELADRHMPGAAKIGAHIAEDKARIDFLWPSPVTSLTRRSTHTTVAARISISSSLPARISIDASTRVASSSE